MAGNVKKKVAALLLGREGSISFPGKNTYPVLGRPLLLYPILAAKNSRYINEVYFSTDSEAYKKIGREAGIHIIDRPPELATKEALGEDAFAHGYRIPIEDSSFTKEARVSSVILMKRAISIPQGLESPVVNVTALSR